jgi:hypothetical protein
MRYVDTDSFCSLIEILLDRWGSLSDFRKKTVIRIIMFEHSALKRARISGFLILGENYGGVD